jgi:sugar lactone lactonase YvrE
MLFNKKIIALSGLLFILSLESKAQNIFPFLQEELGFTRKQDAIAVDYSDDSVYVSSNARIKEQRVHISKFSHEGKYLSSITIPREVTCHKISHMKVDQRDNTLIASCLNIFYPFTYNIVSISQDGEYLNHFEHNYNLRDFAIDRNGLIYTVDEFSATNVKIMNQSGTVLKIIELERSLSVVRGIEFDKEGVIFLLDEFGHVERVNNDGTMIRVISGYTGEVPPFYRTSPLQLAIDSENSFYIANHDKNTVKKYRSNGTFEKIYLSEKELNNPNEINLTSNGNLWVNGVKNLYDEENGEIALFTKNGKKIHSFGRDGNSHCYNYIVKNDIVTFKNKIYFSNFLQNRVSILSDQRNLNEVGLDGYQTPFKNPSGLTIDEYGNLYVASTCSGELKKFDPTGKERLSIDLNKGKQKISTFPNDVAVSKTGKIYIAQNSTKTPFRVFSNKGKLLYKHKVSPRRNMTMPSHAIAVDKFENVYLSSDGRGVIKYKKSFWKYREVLVFKPSRNDSGVNFPSDILDIFINEMGMVFMVGVDGSTGVVVVFDKEANFIYQFKPKNMMGNIIEPTGITQDKNGYLYVMGKDGIVYKYTQFGEPVGV